MNGIKGLIYDMDNTLLRSHIDFEAMKQEVFTCLQSMGRLEGLGSAQGHTTSLLIEHARASGLAPAEEACVWEIAGRHELQGMEGADLEMGAAEVLERLSSHLTLVIVTNNGEAAAGAALERTGISHYFELIVGRESMQALKPSPSGFQRVLAALPQIPAAGWLSVGDSWIDGRASVDAGIPFLWYAGPAGGGRTTPEVLDARGVIPAGTLRSHLELLQWLEARA